MFFFMADTHFGHGAIIDLCHRPFKCVEEMDGYMIERWNKKVSPNDIVYIVGDLFYKHKEPEKVLKQLKGRKRLIIGNHDGGWLKKLDASRYFFQSTISQRLRMASTSSCFVIIRCCAGSMS